MKAAGRGQRCWRNRWKGERSCWLQRISRNCSRLPPPLKCLTSRRFFATRLSASAHSFNGPRANAFAKYSIREARRLAIIRHTHSHNHTRPAGGVAPHASGLYKVRFYKNSLRYSRGWRPSLRLHSWLVNIHDISLLATIA